MSAETPAVVPVFVGELNPYTDRDPRYDLYCEPERSAGARLQTLICGLHKRTYLIRCGRRNLCRGAWSMAAARAEAVNVREVCRVDGLRRNAIVAGARTVPVLLGAKVCRAFDVEYRPFEYHDPDVVVLPHPSGLCRAWNEPGAFDRARYLLRIVFPELPWGELYGDAA